MTPTILIPQTPEHSSANDYTKNADDLRVHIEDDMRANAAPSCSCCGREMRSGKHSVCWKCAF